MGSPTQENTHSWMEAVSNKAAIDGHFGAIAPDIWGSGLGSTRYWEERSWQDGDTGAPLCILPVSIEGVVGSRAPGTE